MFVQRTVTKTVIKIAWFMGPSAWTNPASALSIQPVNTAIHVHRSSGHYILDDRVSYLSDETMISCSLN